MFASAVRADAAGGAPAATAPPAVAAVETDTGAVRVTRERTLSPVARAVRDRARAGAVAETAPAGAPVRAWPRALSMVAVAVAVVTVAFLVVMAARLLLSTAGMRDFLDAYPGEYEPPHAAEPGIPAWARWQHYLNFFFMALIVRSGLQVRRQKKPPAYWTSKRGSKISITLWFHQLLDVVWLLNGAAFVVLLFATGHWVRIVPTSWEVFPNAVSAALQYVSFDWPTENGWVTYNSLQQLAYFAVVFAAAPLAALSGVRMSGVWPTRATRLNRVYPVELARAIHYPTMLFFAVFVVFHVGLVLATGALRNLNHMFAGRDVVDWVGTGVFAVSIAVLAGIWAAARPVVIAPIASLFGRVSER